MDISLDVQVDFKAPDFMAFLTDETRETFHTFDQDLTAGPGMPSVPDGFRYELEEDRRDSDDIRSGDYPFVVEETYRVYQNGLVIGRQKALIHASARLEVEVPFALFLKNNLSDESGAHARQLFHAYDQNTHGPNIATYLDQNRNPVLLTDADFIVRPLPAITVVEQRDRNRQRDDRLIDVDAFQRAHLFSHYNDGSDQPPNPDVGSTVDIIGPDDGTDRPSPPLRTILDEQDVRIGQDYESRRVIDADGSPPAYETDLPQGATADDPRAVETALDKVLRDLLPTNCGQMRMKNIRILTILTWPEFKIAWRRISFKIGCARVSIRVPVMQTRKSKKVLFVGFHLPTDAPRTLLKVAETCAIRSAIASTVIGVVVGNPALGAASFTSLFKACVQRDLVECLSPHLYVVKEAGEWHPRL